LKNLQLICLLFPFFHVNLRAQVPAARPDLQLEILTSQLTHYQFLGTDYSSIAIDSTASHSFLTLPNRSFKKAPEGYFDNYIPLSNTHYPIYVSFSVFNDKEDSVSLFFYIDPKQSVQLCATTDQGVVVNRIEPLIDHQFLVTKQFYKLVVPPGHKQRYTVRVELLQVRSDIFYFWIGPFDQFVDFAWLRIGLDGHIFYLIPFFLE